MKKEMPTEVKAAGSIRAIGQIKKVANCRKGAFTYKEVTLHIVTNAGVLSDHDRLTLDSMYENDAYVNIALDITQKPAGLDDGGDEGDSNQGKLEVE